ncbi:hypothetical protein L596_017993 [Steinernema carpocapsae]|uniref:Uncharacterized protein n=1 Tax=Steinernema carpocapsae TaxID=34508 RepID=A0A4U5N3L8_STECR|nr:hypothetical protein L596_017993 [Steinernema carpocapsae]
MTQGEELRARFYDRQETRRHTARRDVMRCTRRCTTTLLREARDRLLITMLRSQLLEFEAKRTIGGGPLKRVSVILYHLMAPFRNGEREDAYPAFVDAFVQIEPSTNCTSSLCQGNVEVPNDCRHPIASGPPLTA